MKFGKVLQESQLLYGEKWLDYKKLKGMVKACAHVPKQHKLSCCLKRKSRPSQEIRQSQEEEQFFRSLLVEVQKIRTVFVKKQAFYAEKLQNQNQSEVQLEEIVSLYKELLLLENYAVLNYVGLSKILKKHDKWTGFATRTKFIQQHVANQPFVSYTPLLQMINRLEQLYLLNSGLQIDHHKQEAPTTTTCKQVSLGEVQALRDDTWRLKKTETIETTTTTTNKRKISDERLHETATKSSRRQEEKMSFATILN